MPKSFQSTLPVWGATYGEFLIEVVICHFNPRSPCGERHRGRTVKWHKVVISIHAPRVGSDPERKLDCYAPVLFQSTLPVWGATMRCWSVAVTMPISIHAPRVGSDWAHRWSPRRSLHFNPRSPCGERLPQPESRPSPCPHFNPRSPCGERPAAGQSWPAGRRPDFNPRSPCGERPQS